MFAHPNTRREGGFTLLEVAVALLILGLTSAALMPAFKNGPLRVVRDENRRHVALTMNSLMAGAGTLYPLSEGHYSGKDIGDTEWVVQISPWPPATTSSPSSSAGPGMVLVHAEVASGTLLNRVSGNVTTIRLKGGTQ